MAKKEVSKISEKIDLSKVPLEKMTGIEMFLSSFVEKVKKEDVFDPGLWDDLKIDLLEFIQTYNENENKNDDGPMPEDPGMIHHIGSETENGN